MAQAATDVDKLTELNREVKEVTATLEELELEWLELGERLEG